MSNKVPLQPRRALSALALITGLVSGIAVIPTAFASPPPWAPAHGYRAQQYSYVYYPQHQFYYAPHTRNWYWHDAGRWHHGPHLPRVLASFAVGGVNILLEAALPWHQHNHVVHRYPAPRVPHVEHHVYHAPPPPRVVYNSHHHAPPPVVHHGHHKPRHHVPHHKPHRRHHGH